MEGSPESPLRRLGGVGEHTLTAARLVGSPSPIWKEGRRECRVRILLRPVHGV